MKHSEDTYKILGIDPGTNVLGYAVIEIRKKKLFLVQHGVLKLGHLENHQQKLKRIFERIQQLIEQYHPREMAIEAPFFGKNVQSMLKLGRAQGVAIAAAITKGVEMTEYAPKKIKQSVTGSGNASKEQVAAMLESILRQKLTQLSLDATDALAAAVCHFYQSSSVLGKQGQYSGWKGFLESNPNRIKK
ncbi:MAG: crossover junction endodeoxyribonuclease RuvC [Bacteroidota bacterium]